MATINGIEWLDPFEYIDLLNLNVTGSEFGETMRRYKVPFINDLLYPLFRSLEVCDIYNVKDRCHACLKPIENPVPGQKYCSAPLCRKAAARSLEEIRAFLLIAPNDITVGIDARLLAELTEQSRRIGLDLPTTVRYLLYEGIRKQGSPGL